MGLVPQMLAWFYPALLDETSMGAATKLSRLATLDKERVATDNGLIVGY